MKRPILDSVREWLQHGERGTSSETIAGHFLGVPLTQYESEPVDPDDLRRCALMLERCPEVKAWLPAMAAVSPGWRRLIEQWDELVALLWREAEANRGQCPETYRRMARGFHDRTTGAVRKATGAPLHSWICTKGAERMSHDVDGYYSVYSERFPRARKDHECHACAETIRRGDRYARVAIVFEGFEEVVRCMRCQRIHEHLRELEPGYTWPDERLACGEDYEEHWGEKPPDAIAALAFALPGETE